MSRPQCLGCLRLVSVLDPPGFCASCLNRLLDLERAQTADLNRQLVRLYARVDSLYRGIWLMFAMGLVLAALTLKAAPILAPLLGL